MALTLMGKKRGMMQLFDDKGNVVVCTVIQAEPNVVTQVKTKETDGYTAIQLGFEEIKGKHNIRLIRERENPSWATLRRQVLKPRRFLVESKVDVDSVETYSLGQEIGVDIFNEVEFVDATAISKGKGYQGVMKRHHFAGGPASHGSGFHRHAGSTGMRSTPGRGLPGGKKAGHMGTGASHRSKSRSR